MAEFLDMGGYGGYIWPAYLFAGMVLATMTAATLRAFRASQKSLSGLKQNHEA